MAFREIFSKVTIAGFVLFCGVFVHAQNSWNFPDFSATQVLESRKANMVMKVYRSGDSVRVKRSEALSTLYVPSNSRVYSLTTYPDHSHQCVVMKPGQAKMLPSPLELLQGPNVSRTDAGTETVDGHPCKVEKVVVTRSDGKKIESKVWEAQDLQGLPVKIESHVGEIILSASYRDISVGTPERELFTLPEKCTPLEKMGQVVEQKTIR
jgi:hypothetical protein